MSSSLSKPNSPPADDANYYGCLIPQSSEVRPIYFAKEGDRKMWTIGRGEFNAAVLASPTISELSIRTPFRDILTIFGKV